MTSDESLEYLILEPVDENLIEKIILDVENREHRELSDFVIRPDGRFSYKLEFVDETIAKLAEDELKTYKSFCEANFRLGSAIILYNVFNTDNEIFFSRPYQSYSNQLSEFDKQFLNERINLK